MIDVLLQRHLPPYLDQATPDQRVQLDRARRAVHTAAIAWRDQAVSASGSAETAAAEIGASSDRDQLSVSDVAAALQLSGRRVRQLAGGRWEAAGLARKVGGRTWLIDRTVLSLTEPAARTGTA